jgi:hypothetical protein
VGDPGGATATGGSGGAIGFKVLVLLGADRLSNGAQAALRRTMERYMATCRMVLCCESLSRVIAPVRSRCQLVRVPSPSSAELRALLAKVATVHGRAAPSPLLDRVLSACAERDAREALLRLQLGAAVATIPLLRPPAAAPQPPKPPSVAPASQPSGKHQTTPAAAAAPTSAKSATHAGNADAKPLRTNAGNAGAKTLQTNAGNAGAKPLLQLVGAGMVSVMGGIGGLAVAAGGASEARSEWEHALAWVAERLVAAPGLRSLESCRKRIAAVLGVHVSPLLMLDTLADALYRELEPHPPLLSEIVSKLVATCASGLARGSRPFLHLDALVASVAAAILRSP